MRQCQRLRWGESAHRARAAAKIAVCLLVSVGSRCVLGDDGATVPVLDLSSTAPPSTIATSTAAPTKSLTEAPTTPPLDPRYVIKSRWNAGKTGALDSKGNVWQSDASLEPGGLVVQPYKHTPVEYDFSLAPETSTLVAVLFTERYGDELVYHLPITRNGQYAVQLLLVESWHANVTTRVFDVDVQGSRAFTNVSIVRESGLQRPFLKTAVVRVNDNASRITVVLRRSSGSSEPPAISGLVLLEIPVEGSTAAPSAVPTPLVPVAASTTPDLLITTTATPSTSSPTFAAIETARPTEAPPVSPTPTHQRTREPTPVTTSTATATQQPESTLAPSPTTTLQPESTIPPLPTIEVTTDAASAPTVPQVDSTRAPPATTATTLRTTATRESDTTLAPTAGDLSSTLLLPRYTENNAVTALVVRFATAPESVQPALWTRILFAYLEIVVDEARIDIRQIKWYSGSASKTGGEDGVVAVVAMHNEAALTRFKQAFITQNTRDVPLVVSGKVYIGQIDGLEVEERAANDDANGHGASKDAVSGQSTLFIAIVAIVVAGTMCAFVGIAVAVRSSRSSHVSDDFDWDNGVTTISGEEARSMFMATDETTTSSVSSGSRRSSLAPPEHPTGPIFSHETTTSSVSSLWHGGRRGSLAPPEYPTGPFSHEPISVRSIDATSPAFATAMVSLDSEYLTMTASPAILSPMLSPLTRTDVALIEEIECRVASYFDEEDAEYVPMSHGGPLSENVSCDMLTDLRDTADGAPQLACTHDDVLGDEVSMVASSALPPTGVTLIAGERDRQSARPRYPRFNSKDYGPTAFLI
jgi:hypothetical protein